MQLKIHMVTIEDLVPENHFLRKLEAVLDLTFVYEETLPLYSRKYGRPPIDPVVIVKYLLVGFLYGIPSERQIEQRIQTDIALRWYLGLDLFDRVPDHSTISQLRRRKPRIRRIFRRLFEKVVNQCVAKGLASGKLVATDSTHVKAQASLSSEELVEIPEEPGVYWDRLDAYEHEGRAELERRRGKKLRQGKPRTKHLKRNGCRSHKRVSRTDPEAGHMNRPGKPQGPHYLSHQTLDTDCGIILDVAVTSGDKNDGVPYLSQIEHVHNNILPIQAATADSAYDFPLAHRVLEDMGIALFVPKRAYNHDTNTELKRDSFLYDKTLDIYRCPNGKSLRLYALIRSATGLYWQYNSEKQTCIVCSLREKCLSGGQSVRRLGHSYFQPAVEKNRARDASLYNIALRKRQIWCEGSFAAQKRDHNLTRVLRRGLEAAEDHCLLSATALNLKRMIRAAA